MEAAKKYLPILLEFAQEHFEEIIAVSIPVGLGSLVGLLQIQPTKEWYPTLKKPRWTPPAIIFGNMWSIFYAVMGYASYLVWIDGGWYFQKKPLTLYALQLASNLLWPISFFILQRLKLAQAVNLVTLFLASWTAREFWQVNELAGHILIPYLLWLVFANALNYRIWKDNPNEGRTRSNGQNVSGDIVPVKKNGEIQKNNGEEGYGRLQGGATASYNPQMNRSRNNRLAKSPAAPAVLRRPFSLGQRLPVTVSGTVAARLQPHAVARLAARSASAVQSAPRMTARCLAI